MIEENSTSQSEWKSMMRAGLCILEISAIILFATICICSFFFLDQMYSMLFAVGAPLASLIISIVLYRLRHQFSKIKANIIQPTENTTRNGQKSNQPDISCSLNTTAVPANQLEQQSKPDQKKKRSNSAGTKKYKTAKKVGLGCLGIVVIFVLLAIIGAFMGGDNIPKTVQIMPKYDLCFRQWRDLNDFNTQLSQATGRLMGGKGLLEMSDAEATDVGNQMRQEIQTLKTQFAAGGRLWDVPVGTEIKISKFYDRNGNEITPVWNEAQKTFYAPDGNEVYVAGEWNGKTIYTMLTQ
jgi:hypothetical protein